MCQKMTEVVVHHFSIRPQVYKKMHIQPPMVFSMVNCPYNIQDEAKGERYVI